MLNCKLACNPPAQAVLTPTSVTSLSLALRGHGVRQLALERASKHPLPPSIYAGISTSITMAYVAPIHRATSIRHALRAKLVDPDMEDLVIA